MTDWQSPEGLRYSRSLFNKMLYTCLGIYIWEWMMSLDFEWKLIWGRERRRWPLAVYFLNRYLMLVCLCASAALNNLPPTTPGHCKPLMLFVQITGHLTLGMASANLAVRAIAIWDFNKMITGFLGLFVIVQWVFIIVGSIQLEVVWTVNAGCQPHSTNWTIQSLFITSICFDLTVLSLSAFKLRKAISRRFSGFGLTNLVIGHGLSFFILASLGNILAAVFLFMNLNALMSAFFNVPAEVISTIVACRAVRSLMSYMQHEVAMTSHGSRPIAFENSRRPYSGMHVGHLDTGNLTDSDFKNPSHLSPTLTSVAFSVSDVHTRNSTIGQ